MPKIPSPQNPRNITQSGDQKHSDRVIAWWTRVLAASTVLLFIATAVSGYFLWSTDNTISQQLQTSKIQLRAYIAIDQIQSFGITKSDDNGHTESGEKKPDAPEKGSTISVSFKNFGSTPAVGVTPWISSKWYASESEPDFLRPVDNPTSYSSSNLSPGQSFQMGSVYVGQDEFKKSLLKNGNVFLWGSVSYRDTFSGNQIHTYKFCIIVHGSGQIFVWLPQPLVFQVYKPECNYSD